MQKKHIRLNNGAIIYISDNGKSLNNKPRILKDISSEYIHALIQLKQKQKKRNELKVRFNEPHKNDTSLISSDKIPYRTKTVIYSKIYKSAILNDKYYTLVTGKRNFATFFGDVANVESNNREMLILDSESKSMQKAYDVFVKVLESKLKKGFYDKREAVNHFRL
jgi:hypothetical protein